MDADGAEVLTAYVTALPGMEPTLPPAIALLTHHPHCVMHKREMAATTTALSLLLCRQFQVALCLDGGPTSSLMYSPTPSPSRSRALPIQ